MENDATLSLSLLNTKYLSIQYPSPSPVEKEIYSKRENIGKTNLYYM